MANLRRYFGFLILLTSLSTMPMAKADSYNLPSLGDTTSSTISLQQEYHLGQYILRAARQQLPLNTDPLLYAYTHDLIQRLAFYSPLQAKYFDLLMIDSQDFNAFAAPGNIVGVNIGLFRYAETEDQLASVLAHELAHLSQRHYVRQVEQQKENSLAFWAGMLGGIAAALAGQGEAAIASITAGQAAAIQNQLKYSRLHEQEADRIGMDTLNKAGMNPQAVANMFQHMLATTRYRDDIHDFAFMLTHPLTEARVSDAYNQARQYPQRNDQDNFAFHLVQARLLVLNNTPKQAIDLLEKLRDKSPFTTAIDYGIALAQLKDNKPEAAAATIDKLYKDSPHRLAFAMAKIDLLAKQNRMDEAISMAQQHLALIPNNYPLSMQLAQLYLQIYQPEKAAETLQALLASKNYDNPDAWYLLAESEGLAGHIANVHLARAEYFERMGLYNQALKHLHLAMPLLKDQPQATARAQVRMQQIEQMEKSTRRL